MQQHVDDRILEMLLANDQQVIQLLYATYYTPLRKVLRHRVADEQTANDIIVELILSLWEKRHQLALRKPLMGYLSTAARNNAINFQRRQATGRSQDVSYSSAHAEPASPAADTAMLNEDLERIIQQSIDVLDVKTRTIFILSRQEEYTYKEIAAQMKLSQKAIEKHMSKAIRLLSDRFREYLSQ
jgi:RNA polymerase sigma-70 factor (ECF subfamily)